MHAICYDVHSATVGKIMEIHKYEERKDGNIPQAALHAFNLLSILSMSKSIASDPLPGCK